MGDDKKLNGRKEGFFEMSNLKEKWRFGNWKELESDPGLFTLLVEEFGCDGVEVEEVYDLDSFDLHNGDVYGLIFLFKWANDQAPASRTSGKPSRRAREKERNIEREKEPVNYDREIAKNIFFAHQLIPNSCASHALLSVLLNCEEKMSLGAFLSDLRVKLCGLEDPEIRGYALGNLPELAMKHNKFACYEPPCLSELGGTSTTSSLATGETFHYCCYIPHQGQLYELDGLKEWPVDHGPCGQQWLEKAKQVISGRIAKAREKDQGCHDIRYNLMSVVPSRRIEVEKQFNRLRASLAEFKDKLDSGRHLYDATMLDAVNSFDRHGLLTPVKRAKTEPVKTEVAKLGALVQQLRTLLQRCGSLNQRSSISTIQQLVAAAEKAIKQLDSLRRTVEDEETKHTRYEKDAERRSHDYGKFIRVFVEHLHQQSAFNEVLETQRLQQHPHHKPKQVPSVRSRRRSRKPES